MKSTIRKIVITSFLLVAFLQHYAQSLDVSVLNAGSNTLKIVGTASAGGFIAEPNNSWGSMNLTLRIPKTAASPGPTVTMPPSATPEVTGEQTDFIGASPRDAFNGSLDLSMFDLTSFGEPDDGYLYLQVTGTTNDIQNIADGASVLLYEFKLPTTWSCAGCVELLTNDVPSLMAHGISTTSFIDNINNGGAVDVLNVVANNVVLPVHFLSFDARIKGTATDLTWKVSHEESVQGYYVERSSNGANWATLGYVAVQVAAPINNYAYNDKAPLKGANFYRIRQMDLDGKVMYSAIKAVHFKEGPNNISIYPVPVRDRLSLQVQATKEGDAVVRIMDMQGRIIETKKVRLYLGSNKYDIDVHKMISGGYILELESTSGSWRRSFIKN